MRKTPVAQRMKMRDGVRIQLGRHAWTSRMAGEAIGHVLSRCPDPEMVRIHTGPRVARVQDVALRPDPVREGIGDAMRLERSSGDARDGELAVALWNPRGTPEPALVLGADRHLAPEPGALF
jgi:hypothetical protein